MNTLRIGLYIISLLLFSCKGNINKETEKYISKNGIIQKNEGDKDKIQVQETQITKNFVLGKFEYRNNKDFVRIDIKHASKTIYLQKQVYKSFIKMFTAAKKENVSLKIISGTRNFREQKAIWERKWEKYNKLSPIDRAKKILEYSSMPNTSRHHWGTDIDINNLENSYFIKGKGKKEYDWLITNANNYGFYQVYTSKINGRTGYNEEKWHWSYLPLASEYLKFYNENIQYQDIKGFKGYENAIQARMINDYVNGVSKKIIDYLVSLD